MTHIFCNVYQIKINVNAWIIHVSPTVPAIVLPTDRIEGSVLQGSIIGDVTGAAAIVPGKVGGALHLDGVNQSVTFGLYTPVCFRLIEACRDNMGDVVQIGGQHP